MTDKQSTLTWTTQFKLLTNPHIVKAWVKAMGATYLLCLLILVPVFAISGDWDVFPFIMLIFAGVVLGLTLLGFLIMLVILGNHSTARFTLTDTYILYETMDKKAQGLARMAVMAGGLLGSAQTTGAGILSISNESVKADWKEIQKAIYDPAHQTIRLRNSFRDLLHLYCTKENYQAVQTFVEQTIAKNK